MEPIPETCACENALHHSFKAVDDTVGRVGSARPLGGEVDVSLSLPDLRQAMGRGLLQLGPNGLVLSLSRATHGRSCPLAARGSRRAPTAPD